MPSWLPSKLWKRKEAGRTLCCSPHPINPNTGSVTCALLSDPSTTRDQLLRGDIALVTYASVQICLRGNVLTVRDRRAGEKQSEVAPVVYTHEFTGVIEDVHQTRRTAIHVKDELEGERERDE